MLEGKAREELLVTLKESDIETYPEWEKNLTQSIKSVETTQIDLKLNLPKSVTEIGGYFLSGCVGLTRFELPDSVTKIG
jgi:hypothetical protein